MKSSVLKKIKDKLRKNICNPEACAADRLLFRLSLITVVQSGVETITQMAIDALSKEFDVSKAALLLIAEHRIIHASAVGFKPEELKKQEFEELMHKMIESGVRPFLYENIKEESIKTFFQKYDIILSLPVRIGKDEVAILLLGPKNNANPYTENDLNMLNVFGINIGIAVQNTMAFEKLKHFSQELEKEVKKRTEELEETQKREIAKAQDIARLKEEFIFVASHELRTPVTINRGFLELVSAGLDKFPIDVRKNLIAISMAADQLNQLIEDLLEIARSDSGTLKLNLAPHDAVEIIRFSINEISQFAKDKKVTVNFHYKENAIPAICDPSKLTEVMLNLLSNAIKYNHEGGTVNVGIIPIDKFLIVEINDTGLGIPPAEQGKIFQKFFRASTKETRLVPGTGLGLFLVRMLIEKMDGKIAFHSIEHSGTTFAFSLPLAPAKT